MNNRNALIVAVPLAALVAGVRWTYESSMPDLVPTDAQGGIWVLYSAVVSIGTFLLCFVLVYASLVIWRAKRHFVAVPLFASFLLISGCTGNTLLRYSVIRTALADAANPATSSERLRELIGFPTGFGYEIDNRIASNPSSDEESLRILFRKDEEGTLVCLARNPNTPKDLLEELKLNPAEWIQRSLATNPNSNE